MDSLEGVQALFNRSALVTTVNSLARGVILTALDLLARRLPPDQPRADLIVVGAAMVLLFGCA